MRYLVKQYPLNWSKVDGVNVELDEDKAEVVAFDTPGARHLYVKVMTKIHGNMFFEVIEDGGWTSDMKTEWKRFKNHTGEM